MDHTPTLPDVFPQDNINVDDEKHRYQTFGGDSGSVIEETEYTLNKGPVKEITKVTGVVNGSTVEFDNGTDYELADLVRDKQDNFIFNDANDEYVLDDGPDNSTTAVVDDSGDTYTLGVDYALIDSNEFSRNGTLIWLDNGSSPDNGESFTVTYEVTYINSVIKWDKTELTPDADSLFYVSYRSDSIISRYLESANEQLEIVEHDITDAIDSRFVNQAEGEELEELGEMFGDLGKRSGRDDQQYRIYLKSIVQSFISRGTINGIKLAISAATEVPIDDITITEDFEESEYKVKIVPNTPVRGQLVEEIADIADPSGVAQSGTTFVLDPDEVVFNDSVTFTEGQQIPETITLTDAIASPRVDFFEIMVSADGVEINPNTFTTSDSAFASDANAIDPNKNLASDQMAVGDFAAFNRAGASDSLLSDDAFAINPNQTTTAESIIIDDLIDSPRGSANEDISVDELLNVEPVDKNSHRWEETSNTNVETRWGFFEWTEIIELATTLSETLFADDAATVPTKDSDVTDTFFSNDAVTVRFNVSSTTETAFTDDVVTLPSAETTTDTGGSDDTVVPSQTLVAWDTNDWNTLEWVQEHN